MISILCETLAACGSAAAAKSRSTRRTSNLYSRTSLRLVHWQAGGLPYGACAIIKIEGLYERSQDCAVARNHEWSLAVWRRDVRRPQRPLHRAGHRGFHELLRLLFLRQDGPFDVLSAAGDANRKQRSVCACFSHRAKLDATHGPADAEAVADCG